MALIVGADAPGTSEASWASCHRLRAVPAFGLPEGAARVVIVSPHPDDETLGVGGLISMLARRGCSIHVLAVTDGEASHPRSSTITAAELANRRTGERARALHHLAPGATVTRLRIPDGGVTIASELAYHRIAPHLEAADLCLAPFRRDDHPDHDATFDASARACADHAVPLVEYPVWAWHWARPNSDDLPWSRARRIDLDEPARAAKPLAIRAYASQIAPLSPRPGDEPILTAGVLERFHRPFEVVFASP
jgi:LmbE family N-acetylglucosaminyl deacetylase